MIEFESKIELPIVVKVTHYDKDSCEYDVFLDVNDGKLMLPLPNRLYTDIDDEIIEIIEEEIAQREKCYILGHKTIKELKNE